MEKAPLVSIVIPTYNREKTIMRAIDSVLAQTYKNFEIILVDDGSTDDTLNVVQKYLSDKRISYYAHSVNKGVCAAKNTGLDLIKGEWFTILDSDDELVPYAIETMMKVPLGNENSITAVSCNCIDTTSREYSGKGVYENQYLDEEYLMTKCSGEFFGITKTELLGKDRFNERLSGFEGLLWYKINARANRYYIHEALRIYHTEGEDRICKQKVKISSIAKKYRVLIQEKDYLGKLKQFNKRNFEEMCFKAVVALRADNDKLNAKNWLYQLSKGSIYYWLSLMFFLLPSAFIKCALRNYSA
jgi:glycosyltransferase involved in cell wall biosynthesis